MINFQKAEFELSAGNLNQLPANNLPEIVFSGKSNVGKSSLINKLINRKSLARVSAKPGKTITINFYDIVGAKLVDMPGYGYARVSFKEKERWAKLVEGYFNSNRNIALAVQIIDMRHPPSSQDMDMIKYLYDRKINFIIVTTKSDKLNKTQRLEREEKLKEELSGFESIQKLAFSSQNGEGLEELKRIIIESVDKANEGSNI